MVLLSTQMSREHLHYQENLERVQRVGVGRSNNFADFSSQHPMRETYRPAQPSLGFMSASAPNFNLQHVLNVQPLAAIQIPVDTAEFLTTKL